MHGYKNGLFDGFSGFLNWLPERYTGPLLWAFLFILGRSIDWYTSTHGAESPYIYTSSNPLEFGHPENPGESDCESAAQGARTGGASPGRCPIGKGDPGPPERPEWKPPSLNYQR